VGARRRSSTTRTPTPSSPEELAAEAAAVAAREAELYEAARTAARAYGLRALGKLGMLEQAEPREGDEAARDEPTRRAGAYVQADVDAWLAHALPAHLGHYRDPAAREAATGLLPPQVLAHAALLAELARLVPTPASISWRSRPGPSPPHPRPLRPRRVPHPRH
jgi:hypothetical protein